MNEKNLIPFNKRSPDEVRQLGSKGGKVSGERRKLYKSLREAYEAELARESGKEKNLVNGFEKVARALVNEAAKGNVAAAKELAHILGEDVQRVQVESAVPIQIMDNGLE